MKTLQFALVFVLFLRSVRLEGCNINNFGNWPPVVVSSNTLQILYPSLENSPDNRNITIPIGTTIIISCNGGYFSGTYKSTTTILATCNKNSQLEVQDQILNYDTLDCVNFKPIVAKITSEICAPNSVLIQAGFQIGLNVSFLPQIKFCFNLQNLNPVYAVYNITKSIGFIKSYLTTSYVVDAVYNVSVDFDTLYDVKYQVGKINGLVGLPENSTKYVDPVSCNPNPGLSTPGFCFTKRPLAYRGDFVYISQQEATYRYVNVVPQWSFLDYNLDRLERNVVDYVKLNSFDLEVFSGTFGVTSLPHATSGEPVEIFLHDDNKVIPVPLFFWKLIYDPVSRNATVFLTVNNPHLSEDEISSYIICEDISDGMQWLTFEKHNVTKGYTYACSYENAKSVILYLPDIVVNGILL